MFMVIIEEEFPKLASNVCAVPIQTAGPIAQFFGVRRMTVRVNLIWFLRSTEPSLNQLYGQQRWSAIFRPRLWGASIVCQADTPPTTSAGYQLFSRKQTETSAIRFLGCIPRFGKTRLSFSAVLLETGVVFWEASGNWIIITADEDACREQFGYNKHSEEAIMSKWILGTYGVTGMQNIYWNLVCENRTG